MSQCPGVGARVSGRANPGCHYLEEGKAGEGSGEQRAMGGGRERGEGDWAPEGRGVGTEFTEEEGRHISTRSCTFIVSALIFFVHIHVGPRACTSLRHALPYAHGNTHVYIHMDR